MIPVVNTDLSTVEIESMPSLNYQMHLSENRVIGKVDDIDSMKQVIYKILNTERYEHVIYSWNYGIELADLFGQPVQYVVPELQRRITEALIQDDRIESVDSFEFDTSKHHEIVCTFTVHTIFGDTDIDKGVNF